MLYHFKRSLGVVIFSVSCGLTSFSLAGACSPSFDNAASYHDLDTRLKTDVLSENGVIAVIKTKLKYEEPFKNEYLVNRANHNHMNESKLFIQHLDFKIENVLHGHVTSPLTFKTPKMREGNLSREKKRAITPVTFSFWDTFGLSSPTSTWKGSENSCGFHYSIALAPEQYYLAFGWDGKLLYYEPISGLDDPLVHDFRQILNRSAVSQLKRKPEDFFKYIDGYQEIVFEQCPSYDELDYGEFPYPYSWKGDKDKEEIAYLKVAEEYQSSRVFIGDFYSHETGSGRLLGGICQVGDRYLVLDKIIPRPRDAFVGMFANPSPSHRFLKIENGLIDTSYVKSNIEIIGPNLVSVSQIKSWIREANSQ